MDISTDSRAYNQCSIRYNVWYYKTSKTKINPFLKQTLTYRKLRIVRALELFRKVTNNL